MTDLPPPPGGFPPPSSPPPWEQPPWQQPPPPPAGPPGWGQGPPPPGGGWSGYQPPGSRPLPPLANFGERLLGYLLDGLILAAAPVLISLVGLFILATGPDHPGLCTVTDTYVSDGGTYYDRSYQEPCTIPDGSTIAASVLIFLVAAAVGIGMLVYYCRRAGRTGLSWGRKAMGIRLVGVDTLQPIGSWQVFGRFLFASYISASFCYVGYLWMLWDGKRQCWHDKVVDSVVIKG